MKQTILQKALTVLFIMLFMVVGTSRAQSGEQRAGADGRKADGYTLSAASPNPFNPITSFSLTVNQRQFVRVEVYNMLGQPVKRLYQGAMDAGETRTFTFDAGDLPTGIYIYRVQGERFSAARQMTLLK